MSYFRAVALLSATLFCPAPLFSQAPEAFSNPSFTGQDPWVIQWNGNYYYCESDSDAIKIRKSATLTGLNRAPTVTVWSPASPGGYGLTNVWAPEIHFLAGRWYLYFSADQRADRRHRLYVLEGGSDPFDSYAAGHTGLPNGLLADSTGRWAIDPNVFYGPGNELYLTWSCTDNDFGYAPQFLCLAHMSDPLHIASSTVRVSRPVEPWETRTAPIQEGPVGFMRNGATYLTYSGSASWTANDYTVGLLTNTSGNLLDPGAWIKSGPIFDHHANTYGPGSVVFVPSLDGTETWNVYHAYDRLNCPGWGCRSIRMQKVAWSENGVPTLGYPLDPHVFTFVPSGDTGSPTGWGDARAGEPSKGDWSYGGSASADSLGSPRGVDFTQTFRGDLNLLAWTVSAEVREQGHAADAQSAEYGIFALYYDPANQVQAFIDPVLRVVGARAIAGGVDQGLPSHPLPPDFDSSATHTILVVKSAARAFSFYLDGLLFDHRMIPLDYGQIGVYTRRADARFRNVERRDAGFGWGDAHGDAAEGLPRSDPSAFGSGYSQGLWELSDAMSVNSLASDGAMHTLYRGNPNLVDYLVQVEAQPDDPEHLSPDGGYGLIVCHDDRNNQLTLWVNPSRHVMELASVIRGTSSRRSIAALPDLDGTQLHQLAVWKAGSLFAVYLDGVMICQQEFDLINGTVGLATARDGAHFRNFAVLPGAPPDQPQ